jgi:poly(3-hydroxyalkanoate) synthetase
LDCSVLEGAGRRADEIGSVIFCSCTSTRLIPSVTTWLFGQLGIFQTHGSFDLVAASWSRWMADRAGPLGPAPRVGSRRHPVLAVGPGEYVLG